mgnify:CR=1 FL=1
MSRGPGYTEYKLKLTRASVEDLDHHVLILNSSSVSLADLTPPIRLGRQHLSDALISEGLGGSGDPADDVAMDEDVEPGARRFGKKKATRIISLERKKRFDEEEEAREEEETPWVLEDGDAQHTFIGRLEGGQQSNYVVFVNQGRDFLIVPAGNWYRFNPKPAYRPLTTEEAEAQLAARGRNRLLLSQQHQSARQASASSSSLASSKSASSDDQAMAGAKLPKLRALRDSMVDEATVAASIGQFGDSRRALSPFASMRANPAAPLEEMDYDEVFDDDDGEGDTVGAMDEDDPSAPKPVLKLKKSVTRLSAAGRDLGKLVHSLDRRLVDYQFSDQERDPYANPDDFESDDPDEDDDPDSSDNKAEEKDRKTPPPLPQPPHYMPPPRNAPRPARPVSVPLARPASLPHLNANEPVIPMSKPVPASAINSPEKSKKRPAESERSAADDVLPTIGEIRSILERGPIRTKDLIHAMREKLKTEQAKAVFKDIIKQVATVKAAPGEQEKWLELKKGSGV